MAKDSTLQALAQHTADIQERADKALKKRFPGQVVPGCQVIRYRVAGSIYVKVWYGNEYVETVEKDFFQTLTRMHNKTYAVVFAALKECSSAMTN